MLNNDELSRTLTYIKGRFFVEPIYTNLFEEHAAFKITPRPGCIVSKETVMDLLKVVCEHEDKNHRPEPLFSNNIWSLFENTPIIPPIKKSKISILWRTKRGAWSKESFLEIKKIGIKKTYTWLEALMIVIEVVLSENVGYENKTVVYFQHPQETKLIYSFVVKRSYVHGYLAPSLVIDVMCNPRDYDSSFFGAGYGICCQKIPFYKKMSICLQSLVQKNA